MRTSSTSLRVDEDIVYVAAGSYSAVDPDGQGIELDVGLYDLTLSSYLFDSTQGSLSTPNESFTLGETGGDDSNTSIGSLTGMLIAGHDYAYFYSALIAQLSPLPFSDATASGSVSLSFTPIPEPGPGLLLALGLVGIAVIRRRRTAA